MLTENRTNPQVLNQLKTITTGLTMPYEVAVDETNLVVTTNDSLTEVEEFGGVTTIAPVVTGSPGGVLAFEGDYIVVEHATSSLLRISPDGQKSTIATGLGLPIGVAQQGNEFIVVDIGTPDDVIGNARLLRVSLNGDVSIIASNETENLGAPTAVFVDGDNFWLTDFNLGRLLSISSTGEVTEVATDLGQPLDIEFDGENFLITDFAQGFDNPGNGRILELSQLGEIESIITGIGNPSGLTFQESDLIFTDIVEGKVGRISGIHFDDRDINSRQLGTDESDNLIGTDANDFISSNRLDDIIIGRDGNDLLHGGKGDDIIDGGAGIDVIIGEKGDDVLMGGTGRDRFDFAAHHGNNIIVDFEDGIDVIGLGNGLSFEQLTISQIGNDTRVFLDQFSVTLQGVAESAIGVDDFIQVILSSRTYAPTTI